MCHIFAGQAPDTYEGQTRSVRIGGHSTSIRLEAAFWTVLEEVAAHQGMSLGKFVTKLHDEVLELHGEVRNFASLLRCSCLIFLTEVRPAAAGPMPMSAATVHERYLCEGARLRLEAAE
ncbi:ribbon-helix-helix domain-containing protein [Ancylobacter pratisalsi]|uniref:Ribbon-helix-helix domain-containing protein n=1 Tax=Ancylobacter pratisalsi TaxID=1745854 RepID=A0A6P1YKJ3_9HYPH|nr:ribbon-helix-helix domain-containing protein [Ancylobacter pratisalsi]QIB33226.1 ribbon-helix-helix domain-containing protein [Ancylobacter pratisalsi]